MNTFVTCGISSGTSTARTQYSSTSTGSLTDVFPAASLVCPKTHPCCWGGGREKNLTLMIAQRVEAVLRARGFRTAMTRRCDRTVSLGSRAALANSYRSAVLVSIHCNADPQHQARGIETFYTGTAGYRLARNIHTRLDSRTSTPNRGVKRRGLAVLASSRCAAALVECGFMTSPSERGLLATAAYQKRIAAAIADGVTASVR